MQQTKRLILAAATAAVLTIGASAPALADKGGVPNERSCGGVGRVAQTFAAQPGPMDPNALFRSLDPFTCTDTGEENSGGS